MSIYHPDSERLLLLLHIRRMSLPPSISSERDTSFIVDLQKWSLLPTLRLTECWADLTEMPAIITIATRTHVDGVQIRLCDTLL